MRTREFNARHLDVFAFAEAGGQLQGQAGLGDLPRWAELHHNEGTQPPDAQVDWSASAELRPRRAAPPEVWLHLWAEGTLPMTCQRCLGAVDIPMAVDRWFRFVDNEQEAARLDEEADDDVLVLHQAFDLLALVEDELLLDAPLVPRHDDCPDAPAMSSGSIAADDDAESTQNANAPHANDTPDAEEPNGPARKHPFAALAGLRDQLKKG